AEREEPVGVGSTGGDEQLGRQRARDLGLLLHRLGKKGQPVAQGVERNGLKGGWRSRAQARGRIHVELGPLRPGERPLVLMALDEAIDVEYLMLHYGLLVPDVLVALEVVVVKPML